MAEDDLPDFYTWKIVQFGYTPRERIDREPTEAELQRAVVIVVRFRSLDRTNADRYVTIRHPEGFGVVPLYSLMEDIQIAVELASDRYQFELVENP